MISLLTSTYPSKRRFLSIPNQRNRFYTLYFLIVIPSITRSLQISPTINKNLFYNPKSVFNTNAQYSFFDVNGFVRYCHRPFHVSSYPGVKSARTRATDLMAFTNCSCRSHHYSVRAQLGQTLCDNSFSPSGSTFVPTSQTHTRMIHFATKDNTEMDDESGDEFAEKVKLIRAWIKKNGKKNNDDEELKQKQQWLSWLKQGILPPRGADEIKMREAEELGGIPRGDRYASK